MTSRLAFRVNRARLAATLLATLLTAMPTHADSPIAVTKILRNGHFASFVNSQDPVNRIGYRFQEHHPFVFGEVPTADTTTGTAERLVAEFEHARGTVLNSVEIETTEEGWVPQLWRFYMHPVADGIELLWVVSTEDAGLNDYYAVQQCFRLGGAGNKEWKREISETPAFSEYDLWANEDRAGSPHTSLTWVLRNGAWVNLPAVPDHVACRTPAGLKFDTLRTDGHLETITHLDPYGPTQFLADVDDGLIARVSTDGKWVCGLYWGNTTHVSDHQPADCLHAIVNLGPVAPHAKRAIRGKIYWAQLTKSELKERWMADFRIARDN